MKRLGVGDYRVRFPFNNGPLTPIVVGSVDPDSANGSGGDDFVTVARVQDEALYGATVYKVLIRDADGGAEDATFTIVVF